MGYREYTNLAALGLCLSLLLGCSRELFDRIGEMFDMHDALVKAYQHDEIEFHVDNGKQLTISFVNSRFNDLSRQEQREKAEEIARFSASLLNEDWAVQTLAVRFTIEKKLYLIIDYTNTLATFHFTLDALKAQALNRSTVLTARTRPGGTRRASFTG